MSVYDARNPDPDRLQAAHDAEAAITAALIVDDPITGTRYKMDPPCMTAPEEFFHTKAAGSSEVTPAAHALCNGCPAQEQCAVYAAVAGEKFGTWGGLAAAAIRRAYKAGGAAAVRKLVRDSRFKLPADGDAE